MPSFYMSLCMNKNNFSLSFGSFSRKRKSKATLLLCRVGEFRDAASRENALLCLLLLESLSFVITVEHLTAKVQGPGTVWEPISWECGGFHLPNPSTAKHVDELLVLLSVRGIS